MDAAISPSSARRAECSSCSSSLRVCSAISPRRADSSRRALTSSTQIIAAAPSASCTCPPEASTDTRAPSLFRSESSRGSSGSAPRPPSAASSSGGTISSNAAPSMESDSRPRRRRILRLASRMRPLLCRITPAGTLSRAWRTPSSRSGAAALSGDEARAFPRTGSRPRRKADPASRTGTPAMIGRGSTITAPIEAAIRRKRMRESTGVLMR